MLQNGGMTISFPDTIGDKMAGHDMDMLFKMKVPVKNRKDAGLATIKVPVSTMSYHERLQVKYEKSMMLLKIIMLKRCLTKCLLKVK